MNKVVIKAILRPTIIAQSVSHALTGRLLPIYVVSESSVKGRTFYRMDRVQGPSIAGG